MNHRKAMALLQDAMDGRLSLAEQPALEQHLAQCAQCRLYAENLPVLEESLRRSLQSRYPESPADLRLPAFEPGKIQTRHRRIQLSQSYLRNTAWVVLATLFVIALNWVFHTFVPRPTISNLQSATPAVTVTLESIPAPVETETPTPSPEPLPTATPSASTSGSSPILPNLSFSVGVPFPKSPDTVSVYTQNYPQPASLESVRQLGQRLGMDSPVYSYPSEGRDPIYILSDGFRWLSVTAGTADIFNYYADYRQALDNSAPAPSYDQALSDAIAYLQRTGLLELPYTSEPLQDKPGGVRFNRLLDGRPVVFGIGTNPSLFDLDVVMGTDGQVKELDYVAHSYQKTGETPILSAAQAWQTFLESQTARRVRYVINPPAVPSSYRSWLRTYPTGQRLDLYGYPQILKPVDGRSNLLAMVNNLNLPIIGDHLSAFAAQVSPYKFLHLWGQVQQDSRGRQSLYLQGWEVSQLEDLSLYGTIRRQGDQAWLETGDQGRLRLTDLPAELPDGAQANVRGVKTASDVFEWSFIDTGALTTNGLGMMDGCGGGGGGGGSMQNDVTIGGSFSGTSLGNASSTSQAIPPSPTPFSPFTMGETVDGQAGTVRAVDHRYADGHQALEVYLYPGVTGANEPYWQAQLIGSQTDALAKLHNLPVKVWGKVTGMGKDGYPVIEVERFEEVYPGLRMQAWLGTWKPVTLDSKDVLLFTAKDGQQYVLNASIQMGRQAAVGIEGDPVIIEGLAEPGKTFGGYPVITEYSGQVAQGRTDLSGYEISSNTIGTWDESAVDTSAQAIKGNAIVEKIELVYATSMLTRCGEMAAKSPADSPWLVVQPVWRFSGTLVDGRVFEIQVQALTDENLK